MRIEELQGAVKDAAKKLFDTDIEPEITRPDEKFGDYATNAALQLAKKAAATPQQIAQKLVDELQDHPGIKEIGIAGPGFINFRLTDEALAAAALSASDLPKPLAGQEVLVEFGDTNAFKEMHIGHLYTAIVGDAISGLLEASGVNVERVSYHGDIGLHVAKAIWAIKKHIDQTPSMSIPDFFKTDAIIGQYYADGSKAFENDKQAAEDVHIINKHIYERDDPQINEIYDSGRELSIKIFDDIFGNLLQIKFAKHYYESESTPEGLKFVRENKNVFKESQGAIVYEGEKVGLHTRVFITSKGLPTYETKDLGLTELKKMDYPNANRSIIITDHQQSEYFKVMLAALAEIDPALAKKTTHLAHGFLSLTTGKMSSRAGDVYAAMKLLLEVKDAVHAQYPDSPARKEVTFAAVKYAFLKHRLGSDIVFDIKESISLEGSSGPYLQYAHARACSILAKAEKAQAESTGDLDESERALALKISEFPEAVSKAAAELMPHHIATYLYELAQAFNKFYEKSRIIGDEREAIRLGLVKAYKDVLKSGLGILNIAAPEKM